MTSRAVRLSAVLMLWAVALAARFIVGSHIVDDAYITMRYSRHLAALHLISYNPPDAVLGTSTPLWMWLLAAAAGMGVSLPRAAILLAALADLTSIAILLWRPPASALAASAALGAAMAVAAWPAYVTYAVSGMETSVYVCLTIAAATAIARERAGVAGFLAGAAFLCRPDGVLIAVLGAVAALRGRRFRAYAAGVLPATIPWILYAWWMFGSPVPSSVMAKASAGLPWAVSLFNLRAYFLHGAYWLLTPLAIGGLVLLWKDGARFWRLWSTWCVLYTLAMVSANAFTHFMWYYVPLLPAYVAGASAACLAAVEWLYPARVARAWRSPVSVQLTIGVVAVLLLSRMPPLAAYRTSVEAQREALYLEIGSRLGRIAPNCTVAATEIGAVGYAYPGRILDLVGLVSPEVIGRDVTTVLVKSGARWLVTFDSHFDRAAANSPEFKKVFVLRAVRAITPLRALEVYERATGAACGGTIVETATR